MMVSKVAKYLISHDCRGRSPEDIYNEIREQLPSGDPDEIAEAIRVLMTADKETLKLAAENEIRY